MYIDVSFAADALNPSSAYGKLAVVIDVFRATTTIVTALARGAERIVPVSAEKEICRACKNYPDALLAGECMGEKIKGFHFGNSPFEFTHDAVAGRTIIMRTTNGTKAVHKASAAKAVYLGAFVNARAVAKIIEKRGDDIILACAGTQGDFSLEDACCAGYLIVLLEKTKKLELTDSAAAARAIYKQYRDNLPGHLSRSKNGKALLDKGLRSEIGYCCAQDILDLVPVFIPPGFIIPLNSRN